MSDARVVRSGDLPTPFSADEIRAATPLGLTILGRTVEASGTESLWRRTYVEVDDVGSVSDAVDIDDEQNAVGEPNRTEATWAELQAHASFPADATTLVRERIATPLGELDCSRYDVARAGGRMTFWFADAHPGMPIRFGAPDGSRTEVLEIRRP